MTSPAKSTPNSANSPNAGSPATPTYTSPNPTTPASPVRRHNRVRLPTLVITTRPCWQAGTPSPDVSTKGLDPGNVRRLISFAEVPGKDWPQREADDVL